MIKELNDTLSSARSAVGALRTVVAKNGGQRNVAANLAKQVVVNLIALARAGRRRRRGPRRR